MAYSGSERADILTTNAKGAEWRTDPARSGAGGAIGYIGTHAYNLARSVDSKPKLFRRT